MRLALALLLVACGSTKPKVIDHVENDPAWASAYEQRANAGCTCHDAACLERAHAELAKLESDHGGMDDAPPRVQKAHGAFDQCWRDGTKDPARDMSTIADAVCACSEVACLRQFEMDELHIAGKYEVADVKDVAALAPDAATALARAQKCVADVTLAGPKFLEVVQKASDTVCACDNLGCAQTAMKERADSLTGYLQVDDLAALGPKLEPAQKEFCRCLGELVTKEMSGSIMNPFPVKIDATIDCN